MKVASSLLLACFVSSVRGDATTSSATTEEQGTCDSQCVCSGTTDDDSDGVVFDEYCGISSCSSCSAGCYEVQACCTDYLEYCDENFRLFTQFDKAVGNCKGASGTLDRTNVCFANEAVLDGTTYEFDVKSGCMVGCARRAQEGGYDGFAASTSTGDLAGCTEDGTNTCFCSLINGDIGGVQANTARFRCYTSATCSDGVQNGEETGVDCGGVDCDVCPCDDFDQDGVCDEDDSCIENYFNDADSDNVCAGDDDSFCINGDSYNGDTSLCAFSMNTMGVCGNDPISELVVSDMVECQAECVNEEDCAFFSVNATMGAGPCSLYSACDVYPAVFSSYAVDIFYVLETCFDGIENQDEFSADCSGVCSPTCSHCDDGDMNYDEFGIDCGGNDCGACRTFDLVGDGVCLAKALCSATYCFEDSTLTSDDTTCVDVGTSSCVDVASVHCSEEYETSVRGFIVDANDVCDCDVKCYFEENDDINVRITEAWDQNDNRECYGVATCSDGIQNGDETDIDCGGDMCTADCDVDNDDLVDLVDSCPMDPENDIDSDNMCRDDANELCPYRHSGFSTTGAPMYGQSNGEAYCQIASDRLCSSDPLSEDAYADYEHLVLDLRPVELDFLPALRDEELCYQVCTNVDDCEFFALVSTGNDHTCQLYKTCESDDMLIIENSATYTMFETCHDGVLNQNEASTDCGGLCEPSCECTECRTHDFVLVSDVCSSGCDAVSEVYDLEYSDCQALCEFLGVDCDAFLSTPTGCEIHSGCDLYGNSDFLGRHRERRRLQLPLNLPRHNVKHNVPADVMPVPPVLDNIEYNEFAHPSPMPLNKHVHDDFPSPAPRSLLVTRRALQGAVTGVGDASTTEVEDVPAPCNCCYQNYWSKMGPKAGADISGGCRICERDTCVSKKRCFDTSGDISDILWICPQTSTASTLRLPFTTSEAEATTTTQGPTTLETFYCGDSVTTINSQSVGDCADLHADADQLIALIYDMIDTDSLLDNLNGETNLSPSSIVLSSASGLLSGDITSSTPLKSVYDNVDSATYGDVDGVVEFGITISGVSAADLNAPGVEMQLRNAIADSLSLGWYSVHIVLEVDAGGARMRGRRSLSSSVTVGVGITLPITDETLSTTSTTTTTTTSATTTTTIVDFCMVKRTCGDGVKNGDEDQIDCDGTCYDCGATCSDGELNGDEEAVDCGGPQCDACPIDCVEDWSDYGACTVTCGDGIKTRTWEVEVDAAHGGVACTEENGVEDAAACDAADLVKNVCPVDCDGEWTSWTECDRTCGLLGSSMRTFKISVNSSAGGVKCDYDDREVQTLECNRDVYCPIDCRGAWTNWKCDATCGSSVSGSREFSISRAPRFGGIECDVEDGVTETESCPDDCCDNSCAVTLPPAVPNSIMFGTVAGGLDNRVLTDYGVVVGGINNVVQGNYAGLAGGTANRVVSSFSAAGGGRANVISGRFSVIGGGAQNTVNGKDSIALGHDAFVKNCQQSTAVLGFQTDTSSDMCQFYSADQEAAGCSSEGNAIQLCAESVTYNGVDLEQLLGSRRLAESSADHEDVLQQLLDLEMKFRTAIANVDAAIASAYARRRN